MHLPLFSNLETLWQIHTKTLRRERSEPQFTLCQKFRRKVNIFEAFLDFFGSFWNQSSCLSFWTTLKSNFNQFFWHAEESSPYINLTKTSSASDFWSLDCVETLPCSSAGSSFKPKSIMLLPSSNGDHHHTFCLLKLKSFFCQKSSFNLNAWDTQVVVVQVCFKDNHIEASHNEVIKRCEQLLFHL